MPKQDFQIFPNTRDCLSEAFFERFVKNQNPVLSNLETGEQFYIYIHISFGVSTNQSSHSNTYRPLNFIIAVKYTYGVKYI